MRKKIKAKVKAKAKPRVACSSACRVTRQHVAKSEKTSHVVQPQEDAIHRRQVRRRRYRGHERLDARRRTWRRQDPRVAVRQPDAGLRSSLFGHGGSLPAEMRDVESEDVAQPDQRRNLDQEAAGIDGRRSSATTRTCSPKPTRRSIADCASRSGRWKSASARRSTSWASSSASSWNVWSAAAQELREETQAGAAKTCTRRIERMFAELSNVKTDRNLLAGLVRRDRPLPQPGRTAEGRCQGRQCRRPLS